MPNFTYTARSSSGDLVEGSIEAASVDAVASRLVSQGNIPLDISESASSANVGSGIDLGNLLSRPRKPSVTDLIMFTRQMHTLMKAGVPMIRSLSGLIQTTRNRVLAETLQEILIDIESGQELSAAMRPHIEIFTPLFVNMVRVGEHTGQLDESFLRMAIHLERETETLERIKAALRYPTFVFVAIGVAIGIINVFVIPSFATMFERSKVPLPWQTRVLVATSDFFVAYWPLIIGAIVVAVIGFMRYTREGRGRYQWDRIKLNLPIAGGIIQRATLARFSRAFAMALGSGVPVLQAMSIVARALDNDYMAANIDGMRNGIERGDSITHTATLTGMFTPLVLQMMAVGEETGAVDRMLVEVAEYYEREVDYDIKNLSASIEPIIIVSIGVMVVILALGVFLPMWDMATLM